MSLISFPGKIIKPLGITPEMKKIEKFLINIKNTTGRKTGGTIDRLHIIFQNLHPRTERKTFAFLHFSSQGRQFQNLKRTTWQFSNNQE